MEEYRVGGAPSTRGSRAHPILLPVELEGLGALVAKEEGKSLEEICEEKTPWPKILIPCPRKAQVTGCYDFQKARTGDLIAEINEHRFEFSKVVDVHEQQRRILLRKDREKGDLKTGFSHLATAPLPLRENAGGRVLIGIYFHLRCPHPQIEFCALLKTMARHVERV